MKLELFIENTWIGLLENTLQCFMCAFKSFMYSYMWAAL